MSNQCPECKTELKELLFSRYCPNEENHGKKGINKQYGTLTVDQSPLPVPAKVWTQRMTIQITGWSYNAQRRSYYTNFILYAPSPIVGFTLRSTHPSITAFVSGQHISGSGKKTEMTIVAESPTPVAAEIELEVYFP